MNKSVIKAESKPLYALTLHEARAGLAAGEFSSRELTQALLDRIAAVDPCSDTSSTSLSEPSRNARA